MKLDDSVLSVVPVPEWGPYFELPLPDSWEAATASLQLHNIERIAWLCNFIVCAELVRGGKVVVFRPELQADTVFVSTNTVLDHLLDSDTTRTLKIASCGCCMSLTLTKE